MSVVDNEVREVKAFCKQCKKVIPIHIPLNTIEKKLGGLSSYVFVHGNPTHAIVIYIDSQFRVREAKAFSASVDKAVESLRKIADLELPEGTPFLLRILSDENTFLQFFSDIHKKAFTGYTEIKIETSEVNVEGCIVFEEGIACIASLEDKKEKTSIFGCSVFNVLLEFLMENTGIFNIYTLTNDKISVVKDRNLKAQCSLTFEDMVEILEKVKKKIREEEEQTSRVERILRDLKIEKPKLEELEEEDSGFAFSDQGIEFEDAIGKMDIPKGKLITRTSGFVGIEMFLDHLKTKNHNGYLFAVNLKGVSIGIGVVILKNGIPEVAIWEEGGKKIAGSEAFAKFYETEQFETIDVYELTKEVVTELIEKKKEYRIFTVQKEKILEFIARTDKDSIASETANYVENVDRLKENYWSKPSLPVEEPKEDQQKGEQSDVEDQNNH